MYNETDYEPPVAYATRHGRVWSISVYQYGELIGCYRVWTLHDVWVAIGMFHIGRPVRNRR